MRHKETGPGDGRIDLMAVERAAAMLRAGALVAFPTETVYGLGADATSDRAVAGIYAAKGRPGFNPLIVHVPDLAAARRLVRFNPLAEGLAARFWPGPLTLVLPVTEDCPVAPICRAGLPTLAVRVPASPLAQALLRAADIPVAAPSANPSGRLSPTSAEHVGEGLGDRVAMVLDGGPCEVGLESTVVGFDTAEPPRPVLLRPGGLAAEAIEALAGPLRVAGSDDTAPVSPGMLTSHYAPRRPVRLNASAPWPGEIWLGFGPEADTETNLSPGGDLVEAAGNLFRMLHLLDGSDGRTIAVSPIPEEGLGRAINDRLRRAAAGR